MKKKKAKKKKDIVQPKYIKGSKNVAATKREILSTRKKYASGKLTKEDMDRIAKRRSKSAKPNR